MRAEADHKSVSPAPRAGTGRVPRRLLTPRRTRRALAVFGQSGYWEYVSSLVALILCETITFEHWSRPQRRRGSGLRLINAVKVGFLYGIVLNAIKMAG